MLFKIYKPLYFSTSLELLSLSNSKDTGGGFSLGLNFVY